MCSFCLFFVVFSPKMGVFGRYLAYFRCFSGFFTLFIWIDFFGLIVCKMSIQIYSFICPHFDFYWPYFHFCKALSSVGQAGLINVCHVYAQEYLGCPSIIAPVMFCLAKAVGPGKYMFIPPIITANICLCTYLNSSSFS